MRPFHFAVGNFGLLFCASIAGAHEGEHAANATGDPGTSNHVTITEQGDRRIIDANGLPDHATGRFPNRGNPNSIGEQHYHFSVPRKPKANDEGRPLAGFLFGVAINGVVFDPGTAEVWRPGQPIVIRPGPETRMMPGENRRHVWNYDALGTMNLGMDENHAHVQPTGAYHYHGAPTGLIEKLRRESGDDRMLLIGYAADGFAIYSDRGYEKADDSKSPLKKLRSSYQLKKGQRPKGEDGPGGQYDGTFTQDYEYVKGSGDLDECNCRMGVTPEYPDGTYYYVVTDSFPFVPRFFRGAPDPSFEKRGPGPGGRRGQLPPRPGARRPPPRPIEAL